MSDQIVGSKIVKVREMTKKEATEEAWDLNRDGCRVLELDSGVNLYASRDYEGNGPGALFIHDKNDGKYYAI